MWESVGGEECCEMFSFRHDMATRIMNSAALVIYTRPKFHHIWGRWLPGSITSWKAIGSGQLLGEWESSFCEDMGKLNIPLIFPQVVGSPKEGKKKFQSFLFNDLCFLFNWWPRKIGKLTTIAPPYSLRKSRKSDEKWVRGIASGKYSMGNIYSPFC